MIFFVQIWLLQASKGISHDRAIYKIPGSSGGSAPVVPLIKVFRMIKP